MINYSKGQQAVEFALLTGVIFIGCIGIIILFGNNIASFFGENNTLNKVAADSNKTYVSTNLYSSDDASTLDTNTSTIEELYDTKYGKIIDENGTKSIQLNSGVQIDLPENFYETFESTIVDATGSEGMDLFIKKMDEMLVKYYSSNPGVTNADVDMGIGHSEWEGTSFSGVGEGVAYYHIQVGNELLIFHYGKDGNDTYTLEGTINENGYVDCTKGYIYLRDLANLDDPNNEDLFGDFKGEVSEDKKSITGIFEDNAPGANGGEGTWDFYSDNNFEFVAKAP